MYKEQPQFSPYIFGFPLHHCYLHHHIQKKGGAGSEHNRKKNLNITCWHVSGRLSFNKERMYNPLVEKDIFQEDKNKYIKREARITPCPHKHYSEGLSLAAEHSFQRHSFETSLFFVSSLNIVREAPNSHRDKKVKYFVLYCTRQIRLSIPDNIRTSRSSD